MTIQDHLQSFLSAASSSQRTLDVDQQLIGSLQAELDSLTSSTSQLSLPNGSAINVSDLNDVWSQFRRFVSHNSSVEHAGQDAIDLYAHEMESSAADQPTGIDRHASHSSSAAITELFDHLDHLSAVDSQLAESVRQSALAALSSTRSGDEISAELAEIIGFEHLDLVGNIVSDRQAVRAALQDDLHPLLQANGQSNLSNQDQVEIHLPHHQAHHGTSHDAFHRGNRPHIPGSQVVVQTQEERQQARRFKNDLRKANRQRAVDPGDSIRTYTPEELERIREESLAAAANRPLFTGTATGSEEVRYPHVFSSGAQGNVLSVFGQRFALPLGTSREEKQFYEEVTIPPPRTVPMRTNERYVPIPEMDPICRGAFPGYKSLNRLQSAVYPLAYKTNENLLVCAPTGAGKTDVAMLTVMRAISQYARNLEPTAGNAAQGFDIQKNDFKIIYVAPMKALAAEIVRKFSKRLQYLGIKVRELTGDMQMTRQEIAETQMIVTTPEKWDVVTRKPTGEGELATKVRLLIIDEVHLLHDQRGSVIETIVARTLRLVESSQSLIRIVGLSATLPNYVDVADFLRVNRWQGLFYFDSSFRPVPLEQHFLGVKGKAGSQQARANLDKTCFEKVSELVQAGHQVMVFVHARKETVKTSQTLREMFREEAMGDILQASSDENPRKAFFKKELQSSRNREMKELFDSGFGIHHAGMLRSDRTLSERMFEAGVTRVLCCTATLAWGVNLPAYAVVIKGTDVYDSSAGKFIDLSILDVLQIFGRAGRPQYEDLGVGYILTSQDRLSHYVDAITSQHPIESKFIGGMIDSLNAEVSLGTVASVRDGVSWLGYTYLFTRMKRTPLTYGMTYDEVADDPHLGAKRQQLVNVGVKKLVETKMVEHDPVTDRLQVTDLGRIAAKYYIGYRTIETFNERMRSNMSEADVLGLLSQAADFEQIVPRDAEEKELKKMLEAAPCEVSGGIETSPGKVNILLQAYVSRTFIEDFALVSDSAYVAQNAGRIIRSLLEIALSRRWARTASALISMSKAIEKRMWPFDHPLQQSHLNPDTLYAVTERADDVEIEEMAEMSAADIAKLIRVNARMGSAVKQAARSFPRLATTASLRPLSHDLLRIDVRVDRTFDWSERDLGRLHGFYIWIEDEAGSEILQWLTHLTRVTDSHLSTVTFTIPLSDTLPSGLNMRWMSDSWLGSEGNEWIPFDDLVVPDKPPTHDSLLDLPLLPVRSALPDELLCEMYAQKFSAFNALQTQSFHTLMHTSANTLLCGPTASGKSTVAAMAVWRALQQGDKRCIIVVHSRRDTLASALKSTLAVALKQKGVEVKRTSLSKEVLPFVRNDGLGTRVLITTSISLLRALEVGEDLVGSVSLLMAEDLHLLDAGYELMLAKFMWCCARQRANGSAVSIVTPRIVATSASLNDASSLAQWIGADELSTYNFHPKDRPSILNTSFQAFDLPHSSGLLKAMVKPAFDKMKENRDKGPAIVVVPSMWQCFTAASDLITKAAAEMDTEGFLGLPSEEIESILPHILDTSLHEALVHGIGIVHERTVPQDRTVIEHLYEQGLLKVVIITRECLWSTTLRAALVVVMSTQYVRITKAHSTGASDRELVDYSLAELGRAQSLAVRPGTLSDPNPAGECLVLCQTDKARMLEKMLQTGMPLHSSLLQDEHRGAPLLPTVLSEIVTGVVTKDEHVLDVLSWTVLPAELMRNPTYYDCASNDPESVAARLTQIGSDLVQTLVDLKLVERRKGAKDGDASLECTDLGKALHLQPGSTLLHVVRCFTNLSSKPLRAAKEVDTFAPSPRDRKDKEKVEDVAEREVIEATLSQLPLEWRSAFRLSATKVHEEEKPNGKAEAEGEADGSEQTEQSENRDITYGFKHRLLLCLYFAKLELITPATAKVLGMSRRARKRLEKEESELDDQGTGETKFEPAKDGSSHDKAVEKLEREQASEVLALLSSISSVGGRN
ncbi:potential translation-regulating helicase [Pseudozyma hubeiensis SY62]|uniref:Potential translation-regulating helicase n=1 Tax=Pseudozyma hubeiensis (strain SY62) TaxID=1305764 RepID=R9P2J3_PSEHS|nr:potential translation-regulating helicase [Pseudozyma hubeiensis SY62]GAC95623.1 potential translation-regulating helicase [Pseudozyma hubeiensis SY62]